MAGKEITLDLHFPKSGMSISQAFGKQPARQIEGGEFARTSRYLLNVRGYDPLTGRTRGASRPGIRKYISQRVPTVVDAEAIITHLNLIVTAGDDAMQASQFGRVVSTVVVCEGEIYRLLPGATSFETATNLTGNTPAMNEIGLIRSAANGQKLWMLDGVNNVVYDPATNEVSLWTTTAGSLPVDSDGNYGTIIENWRGRICIAGVEGDPQNVYMSKVGDPRNWDYFPTLPSSIDAVAGNSPGSFGLIGDVITTLIAYNDDTMIIGCDHEIHILRGDPNDGGQNDLVTRAIGMAYGLPWCMGPKGEVYFFSNRCGVYVMMPGMAPQCISDSIENELQQIDTGEFGACMGWDDRFKGLYLFLSPLSEPGEGSNFYYDQRNNAWFKDKFRNPKHNPLCCVTFDGNEPGDRSLLIGSWDGYVRTIDPEATDDDGYPIDSEVWIGPLLTKDLDDVTLRSLQAVLGDSSGEVTCDVFAAETAEAAIALATAGATPSESVLFEPSRNLSSRVKVADHAIYIRLKSSVPWSMESIRAITTLNGMKRRRGR